MTTKQELVYAHFVNLTMLIIYRYVHSNNTIQIQRHAKKLQKKNVQTRLDCPERLGDDHPLNLQQGATAKCR